MPLINSSSKDELLSQYVGYDDATMAETSFSDVYSASVGVVIDEEFSISSMLNREGWDERRERVNSMIRAGEIENPDRYRTKGGRNRQLDYDRIAKDLAREDIKTDSQLNQERSDLLKMRREYSQDVVSRGSGMAQFLGSMNAYMIDPINIATVGIAAPAVTAKSVGTIGRVMLASRNAALIEGGTELGIQSLVYQHKQDIDSPYSAGDALANIAMAATGAGVLGAATEGLSGWIKGVLQKADELPESADVATAKSYLQRQQETLKGAPKIDVENAKKQILAEPGKTIDQEMQDIRASILQEAREELLPIAGNKISRGELKQLKSEKHDLEYKLSKVEDPTKSDIQAEVESLKAKDKKSKARTRKAQAQKALEEQAAETRGTIQERIDIINKKISDNEAASKAEADLSRIEQGIIPDQYQRVIDQVLHEKQVQSDVEYLMEMDRRGAQYAAATKDKTTYEKINQPAEPAANPAPPATASQREREILKAQGMAEKYDEEMARYNQLETKVLDVDGELINPDDLIKQLDDEIQGIDDVLRCAYG